MATQPVASDPSAGHPDVVVVLTTLPADADADAFARTLVDERLAACVSVAAGTRSVYRWMNAIERATESQLMIKTTRDRIGLIKTRLATLHPYDVPELLVLPAVDGSDAYLAWVRQCTRS